MILIIDNYDSFTYNLVQIIGNITKNIYVVRNDKISLKEIKNLNPSHIVISPGPGYPKDAGICEMVVKKLQKHIPILGICLGHQAICEVYGAKIVKSKYLMHGKKSSICIQNDNPIFIGLKKKIDVARYHSLVAENKTLPKCLNILSIDKNGEIMAVSHKKYHIYGLQFHPESILTKDGEIILKNFLNIKNKNENKNIIQKAIHKLLYNKVNLNYKISKLVMHEIMNGIATQAQIGSLLTSLHIYGENIEEITAFTEVMKENGIKIVPKVNVMDIVGTGGDNIGTFNISTASAFIAAASGIHIAKHGNNNVSSISGSADVLNKLGANIILNKKQNEMILKKIGICFMFAQLYHPSMKYISSVRKELGIRTIFNILGPLSNPASAKMQLLGVYNKKFIKPLANVLMNLGVTRGIIVSGEDGMDEVSLTGESMICEIRNNTIKNYSIIPEQFNINRCKLSELIGNSSVENANIIKNIFSGNDNGPKRDIVILNAGIAIYLGIDGITLNEGIDIARKLINNGKAKQKLNEFIKITNNNKIFN